MLRRNLIKQWLLDGEGPSIDFKQNITAGHKIARNIVAFANSRGGTIVVGVDDQRRVLGVNLEEEQFLLEQACLKQCIPPVTPQFEEYYVNGKRLLLAYINESAEKPHYALDKSGVGKIFVRIGDQCIEAVPEIEEVLKRGDLNNLQRLHTQIVQIKRELVQYLQQNKKIDVKDYMYLRRCSERNAKRTLLDFLFEGLLVWNDNFIFSLNPKYRHEF